jgi:hypothetical protein
VAASRNHRQSRRQCRGGCSRACSSDNRRLARSVSPAHSTCCAGRPDLATSSQLARAARHPLGDGAQPSLGAGRAAHSRSCGSGRGRKAEPGSIAARTGVELADGERKLAGHLYDAIVIGARCAGASTAMLLARADTASSWSTGRGFPVRSLTGTSSIDTGRRGSAAGGSSTAYWRRAARPSPRC